jgi:3-hydroxybutyryl-CoA dehydratase
VGDEAKVTKQITDKDIRSFAALTGDNNPVHIDEAFATNTRFGKRIAHGFLTASLISTALGTRLPGKGVIYLSQSLQFIAPVYVDDTVTATVSVLSIREDKPIVVLRTVCTNQDGVAVISGEAKVLLDLPESHKPANR